MNPNQKISKKFELKTAQFFKEKGFIVKIGKDARIEGISGARHPIDVLIVDENGTPIKAVECKWKDNDKPVQKGEIEKFITTCKDINAKPIFMTNTSYSKGAEKVAFKENIELYTEKDMEGVKNIFESVEKWKADLERKDEFEKFIRALEALHKSKFIDYYPIITQVYDKAIPGGFNALEFRRLELEDKRLAKNIPYIIDIFLFTKLDEYMKHKRDRFQLTWIEHFFKNSADSLAKLNITLSSFEEFSVSEKIKLFFEAFSILNRNRFFDTSEIEETIKIAKYKNHDSNKNISAWKKYLGTDDKEKIKLIGSMFLLENLNELLSDGQDPSVELKAYDYREIRNLAHYGKQIIDNYLKKKNQVDDLITQISLNE